MSADIIISYNKRILTVGMKEEEDVIVDVVEDNGREDLSSSQRIPKCARCRCHGINNELKGHKEKCQFKECECRLCLMVVERQKITALRVAHLRHQRKVDKQRANKYYSAAYPPLTAEEDYVLSSYMGGSEQARRQRLYAQDRYRYLNGRPYNALTVRQSQYPNPYQSAYGRYNDSYSPRIAAPYHADQAATRVCTQSCCIDRNGEPKSERMGGYVENEVRREREVLHPSATSSYAQKPQTEATRVKYENVESLVEKQSPFVKQEFNNNENDERKDNRSAAPIEAERRGDFVRAKCWEVLSVMFPDFDAKLIRYASERARYNIQLAVEYLLEMKKQRREGDERSSPFATHKQRHQPMKSCPCCYNKPAFNAVVTKTDRSSHPQERRPYLEEFHGKNEC
eukprot:gene17580-19332_t